MSAPNSPPFDFQLWLDAAEARIETHYCIPVRRTDHPTGTTGNLNGAEITLDVDLPAEESLFALLHLFGHTVQWNTDPALSTVGHAPVANPSEEDLAKILKYESDASRLGIALLEEVGGTGMREWMSRWFEADWKFLKHYYTTNGERIDVVVDWVGPVTLLEPLPIPNFQPKPCEYRAAFE